MSHEHEPNRTNSFGLQNFEKNRYFQGKLMTARDMHAEQQYHSRRLHTVNRLTTGTGIVSGLEIADLQEQADGLRVTVEPGVAIDHEGRPIVVKNATTTRLPTPDGDEIFVHLSYEERTKDPVPVPGAEPHSGAQTEESRILEVFEITYRETPPTEYKPISEIEFPDFERQGAADPIDAANEIASAYHESVRAEVDDRTESSVFLGSFKRTLDGEWKPGSETKRRPIVYDNDMLFAALISHITDTDNPHRTTVAEPTDYIESELDQIDRFAVRLERMQTTITSLTETLEVHTDHATRKSLKNTVRFFDAIADRFDDDPETTKFALGITDRAREAIANEAHTHADGYIGFVRDYGKFEAKASSFRTGMKPINSIQPPTMA